MPHYMSAQSAVAIEYTNHISAEGYDPHRQNVLYMTLNNLMVVNNLQWLICHKNPTHQTNKIQYACLHSINTPKERKCNSQNLTAQSGGGEGLEYADSIPCIKIRKSAKKACPRYDTRLLLMMRLQFWRSGLV